jgi:hypothetical protein
MYLHRNSDRFRDPATGGAHWYRTRASVQPRSASAAATALDCCLPSQEQGLDLGEPVGDQSRAGFDIWHRRAIAQMRGQDVFQTGEVGDGVTSLA